MKERPILFSSEMVRALLDGRKTMTRRVVKGAPLGAGCGLFAKDSAVFFRGITPESPGIRSPIRCPYGVRGDRLWMRETWAHDAPDLETCRKRCEDALPTFDYGPYYLATEVAPDTLRWRPSIHMPRWASRVTLELTAVRVELLQEITEEDARAEGVQPLQMDRGSYLPQFEGLWDSLNARRGYGWAVNPWVWVLSFKRIAP